jgi:uncharacterized membrane protein YhaH (DUF805 family)
MNFKQAVCTVFSKYADFSGRATRSEYWYFYLFVFLVNVVLQIFAATGENPPNVIALTVLGIFALAILIPSLSATARRLHDTDRSGWWILLSFVPLIGLILFVWLCQRSTLGQNRFGDEPVA